MDELPQMNDLRIFLIVVKNKSFIQTAEELGFSRSYVSKRIQILEDKLNCKLLHRTSRVIELTAQGEKAYVWAQEILLNYQKMTEELVENEGEPKGNISITSSLGFGRQHIAPLLSKFVKQYPKVMIRFDTIDKIQDLVEQHVDLDIHVGEKIAPNLIAKKLANNIRILCASPEYLRQHGMPEKLSDLLNHSCLIIQERDSSYAIWKLQSRRKEREKDFFKDGAEKEEQIKVFGKLSSNNGELVRYWALDGQGIMLRSVWDIKEEISQGRLVRVLPEYYQEAPVWAVFPTRLSNSINLRTLVEFLEKEIPKGLKI